MTLDRGMSGSRARRSLVASRARCATWKPPDTGTEEATALSAYLDENRDPPAALILTDDVRNIQEDLDPQSCSQPRCGAMPPWSRLDQRSPAPVPVSPVPPQTGETSASLGIRSLYLCILLHVLARRSSQESASYCAANSAEPEMTTDRFPVLSAVPHAKEQQ